MSAVELAAPVEVSEIRGPTDRFRCPIFSAVLTADSCAARQRTAREEGPMSRCGKCFDCSLGRQVVEQLGAEHPEETVAPCKWHGCPKGDVDSGYCAMHVIIARRQGVVPKLEQPLTPELQAVADAPVKLDGSYPTVRCATCGVEHLRPKEAPAGWRCAACLTRQRQSRESAAAAPTEVVTRGPATRRESQTSADPAGLVGNQEEGTMPKCERAGCDRPADQDFGDGTLCMPHYRGERTAAALRGKPRGSTKAAPEPPRPPRGRKPPPRQSRAAAPGRPEHLALETLLDQAREAVELVNAIGWDLARQLAERCRGKD